MISAILIINLRGDVVINRYYRGDVSRSAANTFRMKVIAAKEAGSQPPVKLIGSSSFIYVKYSDMYFVAVSRKNVNPAMVFHFLLHLINIFKSYFEADFNEDKIRDNFTLVYELLDEVLDYGYPQNSAIDVLRLYINLGEVKAASDIKDTAITSQITGAIDWRREGIRHRKNEIFIDVMEKVNLLMSSSGAVLKEDVVGHVQMKTFLTGMPECKFGLNDKLNMENEKRRKKKSVELDDCTFHRCVRLGKFDADRTITFIPPDGEFELMRYRITSNIDSAFKVIPVVEEKAGNTVNITCKVISQYDANLFSTTCVIKVPCPPTTARCKIQVTTGRAKYEPAEHAIVWRCRRFPGKSEATLSAHIETMKATYEKAWSKPPISMEFQVPMFTASGLHVRYLKVFEKSSYKPIKWVRYVTRAGQYQIRI